jgi:hypothetical protein
MTTRQKAQFFIHDNATKYCRTWQEGAKYLVGKLIPTEMPHPKVWNEILKIAKEGMTIK